MDIEEKLKSALKLSKNINFALDKSPYPVHSHMLKYTDVIIGIKTKSKNDIMGNATKHSPYIFSSLPNFDTFLATLICQYYK